MYFYPLNLSILHSTLVLRHIWLELVKPGATRVGPVVQVIESVIQALSIRLALLLLRVVRFDAQIEDLMALLILES